MKCEELSLIHYLTFANSFQKSKFYYSHLIAKANPSSIVTLLENILFKMPPPEKDPFSSSQMSQFCLHLLSILLKSFQQGNDLKPLVVQCLKKWIVSHKDL